MSKPFLVEIKNRGSIHVEGEDRNQLMQELMTADISKLRPDNCLYACMLDENGRYLHDFFVSDGGSFLIIDCEGGERTEELHKRINEYRMRLKVKAEIEQTDTFVYSVFNFPVIPPGVTDPRHAELGFRTFIRPPVEEMPFEEYDKLRIKLGLPDGTRDLVPGKSSIVECNLHHFGAIDMDKADDYVGKQAVLKEIAAGVDERLYPVRLEFDAPSPFSDIRIEGEVVGDMRSACGDVGLAMLKDSAFEEMQGSHINPFRPEWME